MKFLEILIKEYHFDYYEAYVKEGKNLNWYAS